MSEKIYPEGLRTFAPREGAPDFVKGTLIITVNDLVKFCKDNESLLSEYNGQKQLKCNMLQGDKGIYFTVDTWKPNVEQPKPEKEPVDDLPF